jgi:hypothetical protein
MKRIALAVMLLAAVSLIAADRDLQFFKPPKAETQPTPRVEPEPAPRPGVRRNAQTAWYYVCPKDEAMLRVKRDPRGKAYHCPVDGQEMVLGRGPTGMYFYVGE